MKVTFLISAASLLVISFCSAEQTKNYSGNDGVTTRFLAVGENGIWTLNQVDGTVSRIDPYTNKLIATIDAKVIGSGGDIAAGAGKIWVRGNKTAFLVTIDPKTNVVRDRYGPLSGSGAVRVTADSNVWISAHDINTIWIIK